MQLDHLSARHSGLGTRAAVYRDILQSERAPRGLFEEGGVLACLPSFSDFLDLWEVLLPSEVLGL